MGFDRLTKVNPIKVKEKKSKTVLPKDELMAEFVGYKKTFIKRTKYIFEYDQAVACYEEIESDYPSILDIYADDKLCKNIERNGNTIKYEWNDNYFEQKGRGCTKEEIKDFLKSQKYKIKKKKDK